MSIYHNCDQYSDAWNALRLGLPTASQFHKIITPKGTPSKSWRGYAHHLIAERILGRAVDTYTSEHMERGLFLESAAVELYEMVNEESTKTIGFITNDEKTIGCSPDRLIGDNGLLEVKVPKPATQIEYLLTGEVDREYWPQLQGQLWISERKWIDIISFHPELPPAIIRVERDLEFIACLEAQLTEFNHFITEVMDKISTMTNLNKRKSHEHTEIQF